MRIGTNRLPLAIIAATICIWAASRAATADLVFQDNYESWTIGAVPDQPGVTDQAHWSYDAPVELPEGAPRGHSIQANPLVDAKNPSAQVLESIRDTPEAEHAYLDLTPDQQTRLANGELLTVQFKHYQPASNRTSIAFAVYQNSNHDGTENPIDLEFRLNRAVVHYKDSLNDFQSTGLFGTADWDDVKVVVNFTTDTWTVTLNGVSSGDLTFRNDGDYSTAASLLFNASTGHETGYTDDFKVYIGAVPVGVSGDYNNNGVVDAADYVLWRNGGPLQNEVDAPGTVNSADYTAWRTRFGNTSGSGASSGLVAVPEPACAALAMWTVLLTMARRRSARRQFQIFAG